MFEIKVNSVITFKIYYSYKNYSDKYIKHGFHIPSKKCPSKQQNQHKNKNCLTLVKVSSLPRKLTQEKNCI